MPAREGSRELLPNEAHTFLRSTCWKKVKEIETSVDGSELEAVIVCNMRLALCLHF